jgi:hypothetical protein
MRRLAAGRLSLSPRSDHGRVRFEGRVPGPGWLPPGRYALAARAQNAAGRSLPRMLTFTVVR